MTTPNDQEIALVDRIIQHIHDLNTMLWERYHTELVDRIIPDNPHVDWDDLQSEPFSDDDIPF